MDEKKIEEVMRLVETYRATGGGIYKKAIEKAIRQLLGEQHG